MSRPCAAQTALVIALYEHVGDIKIVDTALDSEADAEARAGADEAPRLHCARLPPRSTPSEMTSEADLRLDGAAGALRNVRVRWFEWWLMRLEGESDMDASEFPKVSVLVLARAFLAANIPITVASAQDVPVPRFKNDPNWPKPLPQVKDSAGQLRRWQTGEVGGICIDSHNRIITMIRGWQNDALGGLLMTEALAGMPAPPVVIYDAAGNVTASWGDASYVE